VKPAPFEYLRAASVDEAVAALASCGADAGGQDPGGGQSLVPLLALRMARPDVLVDITGWPACPTSHSSTVCCTSAR